MGRRLKQKKACKIIAMSSEGYGITKPDEKVIFVENAVPGDIADITIRRKKKGHAFATIDKITQESDIRQKPFCDHFDDCGGCKWQYLPYQEQLRFKEETVANAFRKIGGIIDFKQTPILGCEEDQYYRNKLEFTFSNKRWLSFEEAKSEHEFERRALGFHKPGMFDKIVDVEHCYLQLEPSNRIRNFIREFAIEHNLPFFDLREQKGLLRNLVVRTSTLGEVMVLVCFFEDDQSNILHLMKAIDKAFPNLTSLQYLINPKKNDSYLDLEPVVFKGAAFIREKLGDFVFKIGAKSFFQTNPKQAENLYQLAMDMANLKDHELLYDLYAGVGSIGIFMSKSVKQVIGLEYVEAAIEDAKINAQENRVENCAFYAGDVKDLFNNELITQHGKPDVLITDPPRAGMHADVVKKLLEVAPKRLVYISCNPATQARDVQLLSEKYEYKNSQAVDMFPQTTHIENVCLLELKN